MGESSSRYFTRHSHYVPQLYLKRWADPQGRLWVYNLLVPHEKVPLWKRGSVKGVAYQAHLYTRILASGETDEIEQWFEREFETPAAPSIQRALSEEPLTKADWIRLARFVAVQDVRTPAHLIENMKRWRETMQPTLHSTLEEAKRAFEAARKAGVPLRSQTTTNTRHFPMRVTTERAPDGKGGTLRVETFAGRGMWLFSIEVALNRPIRFLEAHRWTILKSPPEVGWVTTDSPVVRLNCYEEGSYDFGGGWGRPGTEILLPLGPHHLLYTRVGDKHPPQRGTVLSKDDALVFQRLIVEHSLRFVFSRAPDPLVPRFRARVVDAKAMTDERTQWNSWHEDQSAAEENLKR